LPFVKLPRDFLLLLHRHDNFRIIFQHEINERSRLPKLTESR
jgi:hypothetical protein